MTRETQATRDLLLRSFGTGQVDQRPVGKVQLRLVAADHQSRNAAGFEPMEKRLTLREGGAIADGHHDRVDVALPRPARSGLDIRRPIHVPVVGGNKSLTPAGSVSVAPTSSTCMKRPAIKLSNNQASTTGYWAIRLLSY